MVPNFDQDQSSTTFKEFPDITDVSSLFNFHSDLIIT